MKTLLFPRITFLLAASLLALGCASTGNQKCNGLAGNFNKVPEQLTFVNVRNFEENGKHYTLGYTIDSKGKKGKLQLLNDEWNYDGTSNSDAK